MIDLPREEGFFRRELPGGVRLVGQTVPGRRSLALGVWLRVGSRDEEPGREGMAHFLEHMVFKGTARRTPGEIAGSLERVGGSLDAFTTKEATCFYARALSEHQDLAADVLADLVSHPRLTAADVALERGVVDEEIRSAEDTPEELIGELVHRHLWPEHILGAPILGTRESLARVDPESVRGFHARTYRLPRVVVSAVGDVDEEALARDLPRLLELPAGDDGDGRRPPPPAAPTRVVHESDLAQLHVGLVAPAPSAVDPARRCVQLLSDILGGGMSSRLFQRIREEAGLAYSIYAYTEHYDDAGLIGVSLTVSPERAEEAVERTLAELRALPRQGLLPGELDSVKAQVRGALVMSLESLSNTMFHLARTELTHGGPEPLQETLRAFERVTEAEILDAAETLLDPARLTLVALGPARPDQLRVFDASRVDAALP